jgi:hypothetical protein
LEQRLREEQKMATYAEKITSESGPSVKDKTSEMINDVTSEVRHEVNRIQTDKTPVDPSQSDHVVRRHAAGLSIWFFVAIALFLVLVTAAIMIYSRIQH